MTTLTLDDLLNPDFDLRKWVLDRTVEIILIRFFENQKVIDYDFIYGEGSYEELIFGGGAGL